MLLEGWMAVKATLKIAYSNQKINERKREEKKKKMNRNEKKKKKKKKKKKVG